MGGVTTVAEILQSMMGKPSILTADGRCAICGRYPSGLVGVERHHIVRRSAGRMFVEGRELKKPVVMVCGFGNNLRDSNGRMLCHGAAHHGHLHFRWHEVEQTKNEYVRNPVPFLGYWEYLMTKEPCEYQEALSRKGWKRLRVCAPEQTFGDGRPKFMKEAEAERNEVRRGLMLGE